jgi:hypothetical protein
MKTMPSIPVRPTEPDEASVRERAYYLWLERGCPAGQDEAIWHAAKALLHDRSPSRVPSVKVALAAHERDPRHRFHARVKSPDQRQAVAASGAMQRVRADRPQT